MGRSRKFHADPVIRKSDGIISAFNRLAAVIVMRTPTLAWMVRPAGCRFEFAYHRHGQQVSEIPVPANATHARITESLNRGLFVGVTWRIVTSGHGIGAQLYHAERGGGPRKSLSFTQLYAGACSNERINPIGIVLGSGGGVAESCHRHAG